MWCDKKNYICKKIKFMKAFLLSIFMFWFLLSYSQVQCEKMTFDSNKWEQLENSHLLKWEKAMNELPRREKRRMAKDIEWAKIIKDSFVYSYNDADELEGEYVFLLDSPQKIENLKDATLDFFSKHFTVSSHYKKDVDKRSYLKESGTNSIYLHTVYKQASFMASGLATHAIDIDVVFIVKFKEDKIKITISIPNYQYYSGIKNDIRKIKSYPPYTTYGTSKKEIRDDSFFCKAYIKANECILRYTKLYYEYLNKSLKDW